MRDAPRPRQFHRTIHEYALSLLAARAYTSRSLERKLFSRNFGSGEVAREIAALASAGLVDDAAFAREYARQKLTIGGKSTRRVELELIRKGISPAEARAAVALVLAEEGVDTGQSLRLAGEKKLSSMRGIERTKQRKRLIAYLARRGFEIDAVRRYVDERFP